MDKLFLFVDVLILLIMALVVLIWQWRQKKITVAAGYDNCTRLPPGRSGWPIIGEGLEFYRAGVKGFPEKFFYDRMQKYSSQTFRTSLLGEDVTVMCGAAGNKFLFSNEYKLVNAWLPPSIRKILSSVNQSYREQKMKTLRKFLSQFLKPEALQRYIGVMDSMTRQHFETHWDNDGHNKVIILHPLIKKYSFSLACRLLLGIDNDDQARVDELLMKPFTTVHNGLISIPIDFPGTPFNRAIRASKSLKKEILSMIKQRKKHLAEKGGTWCSTHDQEDILSQMILFSDEESGKFISEPYIADAILGLTMAGHDTTTSVITMVMKYLAEFPDVYDKVLNEHTEIARSKAISDVGEMLNWDDIKKMTYSWNVVCEAMRLAPPLQGGFKQAITDFTYAGYFIPKGWKLYWSAISTHKNPEYFPDPERFDPSRFEGKGPAPYTFVPFSGGAGTCPGKEYARLEILIFMHHAVTRYKWKKLLPARATAGSDDNDDDDKLIFTPFPYPTKGLPVFLQPHHPADE